MSQGSGSMLEDRTMGQTNRQWKSGTQVRFTIAELNDSLKPSSSQPSPARVRGKAARRTPFSQESQSSQSSKTSSTVSPSAAITPAGSGNRSSSRKKKRKGFQQTTSVKSKTKSSSGSNIETQHRGTQNLNYATQQWPAQLVSLDVEDHGSDGDQDAADKEAVFDENTVELLGSDLQDDLMEESVEEPSATSPIVKLSSSNDSAGSKKSPTSRIDSSEPTTLSQIQPGQRLPSVSQSMVVHEAYQSMEFRSELSQDQPYSDLESQDLLIELDGSPAHYSSTENEFELSETSRQRRALIDQLDEILVYSHKYGQDPGEDNFGEAEPDYEGEPNMGAEWEDMSPELERRGERDVSAQVDDDESPQAMEANVSPKKHITLHPRTTTNTSASAIQASLTQNKSQEQLRISHLFESSVGQSYRTSTRSSLLISDGSAPRNIVEVVRRSTKLPVTVVRSSQGSSSGTTDYSQEGRASVVRPAAAPTPSKKLSTGRDSIPNALTVSKISRNAKETFVCIEIPPVSDRIKLKRLAEARMARNHAESTSPSATLLHPGRRSARSVTPTPPVSITQTPESRRHSTGQPSKRKLHSERNGEARHFAQVDVNPDNYHLDQRIFKETSRWADGGPKSSNQYEVAADSPSRELRSYSNVMPPQDYDRSGDPSRRDSLQPRRSVSLDHSHTQDEDGPKYDSPISHGERQRAPIHRAERMARRTGLPIQGARKLGTSSYGTKLLKKTTSSSSEWDGPLLEYQSEDHADVHGMEANDVVEGGRVEMDLSSMAIHLGGLDEPEATANNEVRHLRKRPRRMIVPESETPERTTDDSNDLMASFAVRMSPQERISATPTFSPTTANASHGYETRGDSSSEEVERLRTIWRNHGLRWPFWSGDGAFPAEAYSSGYVFGTALPLPRTAGK